MRVLVAYGTTEGQTRKVAQFVANEASAGGHATTLLDCQASGPRADLRGFDRIFVAASLHAGSYQPAVARFVAAHRDVLSKQCSIFLSVSLSAAWRTPEDRRGLDRCVDHLLRETGWKPRHVHHVAGAFRFTQYGLLKRWILKAIAYRRGQPTDTTRDSELTDWAELAAFVGRTLPDLGEPVTSASRS